MERQHFNRAAGFRRLGARKSARMVTHQTEAAAGIDAAMEIIFTAVHELAKAHKKLGAAECELVDANRIACSAEYQPPASADLADASMAVVA